MFNPRVVALIVLVVAPGLLRATQFAWNVVPIGALAIFAGAYVRDRRIAFLVPLASMVIGDFLIGWLRRDFSFFTFHTLLPLVYACYVLNVWMGTRLQTRWDRLSAQPRLARRTRSPWATHILPIAGTTLAGSVVFFVVTNFGDWLLFYPRTWDGLMQCYIAAIPFFRNTLLSDAGGAALLFGGLALLRQYAGDRVGFEKARM